MHTNLTNFVKFSSLAGSESVGGDAKAVRAVRQSAYQWGGSEEDQLAGTRRGAVDQCERARESERASERAMAAAATKEWHVEARRDRRDHRARSTWPDRISRLYRGQYCTLVLPRRQPATTRPPYSCRCAFGLSPVYCSIRCLYNHTGARAQDVFKETISDGKYRTGKWPTK